MVWTTLGAQALFALRLGAAWQARPARAAGLADLALLAYPLLLLVTMSAGRAQNGIKYLLPAWPLAIVWLARVLPEAARACEVGPAALGETIGDFACLSVALQGDVA